MDTRSTDRSTVSTAPFARGRCLFLSPAAVAASGPASPAAARRPAGCWEHWKPPAPTAGCPPPTSCTEKQQLSGAAPRNGSADPQPAHRGGRMAFRISCGSFADAAAAAVRGRDGGTGPGGGEDCGMAFSGRA